MVNDQLFFKNQEISTDLNSFSFEAKEDKNQILHQPNTKTNLTNSSFVLQMSNQVVNIKKISNSSESGMFLYIDDMRITRLKSGISYLSIDKEGIIHLAYVTF